ncbi:MAG: DUF4382 domain-containing protein [Gemmatimonadetes bacterium]|nr:DUF4382 domain-containing protein [Gemmatimonadota bacterium]
MRNNRNRATVMAWYALSFLAVACSDSTGAGTGKLTVQLTDAPFPFDSVARADVFVVRVDGKLSATDDADAAAGTEASNNTDPGKGWVTLAEPNKSFNLLDLQNGTTVNLGEATLPTGMYQGFRLILNTDQSSVTLKNGTVLNGSSATGIKWPSAGQTGIKIVLDQAINLVEGGTVMVLDFNLGQSFVLRGNTISQNGLLFKPVIKAVARDVTGSVSGTVRQDNATGAVVADATVEVLKSGTALTDTDPANVVASGKTDASGNFKIAFLMPGTYELRATPPSSLAASYDAVLKTSVTVSTGADAGGNVLVLPHK